VDKGTLFKIYLEQALKAWKRKCKDMGISLNNTTLYGLSFADDQVILSQEEYTKWGLEVNVNKTEYMCNKTLSSKIHNRE